MSLAGFGQIAEQLRRSTVQVTSGQRGQGSGIIVSSNGLIATNAHVVRDSHLAVQLWDGSSFPASVHAKSARRDLAILKIPTVNLTPATLGNSDNLRVGELVIAVGNPLGFVGAVTSGIVHAIGRRPGLGPAKWIQAEVQLAPGNSGGPLADAQGNVMGVNSMVADGLGLAVPSRAVNRLLAGDLQPAPLGVALRPVALRAAAGERLGLAIAEVAQGSAAEYASLKVGDILVGIEGRELRSLDDLELALEGSAERILRLQFVRDDLHKLRSVTVRLGAAQTTAV